jgi:hypothetical protein
MAQELRRDQPVRLPNPSAQPFVTALKTVRFFSVLFFWVAMVSVAAYAVAFVLMEWVGLYDAPPLAVQPPSEAKAPAEPGTPAEPAEKASEKSAATEKSGEKSSEPAEPLPGHRPALSPEKSAKPKTSAEKSGAQGPSFFALFENTAQAAPEPKPAPAKTPGEPNFMGVPAGPVRSASKDSEAPAAPAEKSGAQGPSFFALFENTAQAAPEPKPAPAKTPGEPNFMGVPAGSARSASKDSEVPAAPAEKAAAPASAEKSVAPPAAAPSKEGETTGKIEGKAETPLPERAPPTPVERRLQAAKYHDMTMQILRPLRVIGTIFSLLLAASLFLYLQIALLGRLAGIRQLTNALFLMLLFLATILPWDSFLQDIHVSSFYEFAKLTAAHAARLQGDTGDFWKQALYFIRFLAMPLVSIGLLAWSGIQFAAGYSESVIANE